MKKLRILNYIGACLVLVAASSCQDELDINDNPNQPTSAGVDLVLPQAIVSTAAAANQFNSYGAHFGGMVANAGGFGGFGNLLNYSLTPTDYTPLWNTTYQDPLKDLKYVLDQTDGKPEYANFNAAAKILRAYNYQKLVDAFGDVPYTEALRAEEGIANPTYTPAQDIYRDLFSQLTAAIDTILTAKPSVALRLTYASDPLFGAAAERTRQDELDDWVRFANTLRLRILIRVSDVPEFNAFVTENLPKLDVQRGKDEDNNVIDFVGDYLTKDAIVDPGYETNRPNPTWATFGKTVAGELTTTASSRIPTAFSFGFYDGDKLSDVARGTANYVNYPSTPINQLGNEIGNPKVITGTVTWTGNTTTYVTGVGILKGPGMGAPLMLAAESYFLQAEKDLRSGGDPATAFNNGITAAFTYTFTDENGAPKLPTGKTVADLVASYIDENTDESTSEVNYLVDVSAASTFEEKLEAIITQKYIALNMVNGDEAYNEFRRTTYPRTIPGGGPSFDIASNKSGVTNRADRLPTRIMYPSSEQSYNAANYRNVDYKTEKIFWDIKD